MVASQNGWKANDRSVVSTRLVPGTGVKVAVRNGDPGDLLLEVMGRFDREVEDLDQGADDWGYAERPVRGGTDLSNHASGTAIDGNATKHPLGTEPSANFTREQVDAIHRILAATRVPRGVQVVRWGGDYSGRKDGMHFELNDGTTVEDTSVALAQLRASSTGVPVSAAAQVAAGGGFLQRGVPKSAAVAKLQRVLAAWYGLPASFADGLYGPATEDAVRRVQEHTPGLKVDGIAGPATLRALGLA